MNNPFEYCAQKALDEIDRGLELEEFNKILNTLSDREALIFRLKMFQDKSFKDIGKLIELSLERTRMIFHKSVRKIRHRKNGES